MKTLAALVVLLLVAHCQEAARAQVPGAVIPMDFTDEDRPPRKRLTEAGLTWQIPVKFAMLRERVTLAVKTPEAGEVALAMDGGEALVEVKTTREGPTSVRIEVRSTLGRMSVEALQEQVRAQIREELAKPFAQAAAESRTKSPVECRRYLQMHGKVPPREDAALRTAYEERRGIELGRDLLRKGLETLVAKRMRWVPQSEQATWLKASEERLHKEYLRLLGLDIAEEHLKKCGFEIEEATRNFDNLIVAKFKGLHAFATGAAADGDPATMQALCSITREEQARLVQALTIQGVCQFVPQTAEGDDNSHWFNGQRIGTSIVAVPAVRVIGRLDAASGDRSDWWTLLDYDEDKIRLKFADVKGLQYEIYQSPRKETCLRIVATREQAFAYSFELLKRSSGGEGQAVVIHESPGNSDAKFPF